MANQQHEQGPQFYGSVTLGERGQIVIPAEARQRLGLEKGEKLLVFGMGDQMLAISKFSQLEEFEAHLSARLTAIREALRGESAA